MILRMWYQLGFNRKIVLVDDDQSGIPNSIGRLTSVTNGVSTTNYLGFDPMGRVTGSSQTTGSVSGNFGYTYTLAGELNTLTYPSGRTLTMTYDGENRVGTITGKATPTSSVVTYASGPSSNIHYTAHGAVDQLKLGNGLFEQTAFNSLLQPTAVNLGTTLGAHDVWGISNGYAAAGHNNGNLLSQQVFATGMGAVTETFLYDALNR